MLDGPAWEGDQVATDHSKLRDVMEGWAGGGECCSSYPFGLVRVMDFRIPRIWSRASNRCRWL